MLNEEIHAQY
jgi:hypothetical protein